MRGALAGVDGVERLDVRLPARELSVWHRGDVDEVRAALEALRLGVSLSHSDAADAEAMPEERNQRSVLQFLLAVNAIMFAVELVAGWHGESTGLLSDALDMLADAMVYGVALWAVGQDDVRQKAAARVSGYLQLGLGLGVLLEVVRRAWIGSTPEPPVMMVMALVALAANLACVIALARHRGDGVHMRASWIFSTNDVIANLGVLLAGALVHWTRAAWPDFVVGTIIGLVVIRGATRILRLGRE